MAHEGPAPALRVPGKRMKGACHLTHCFVLLVALLTIFLGGLLRAPSRHPFVAPFPFCSIAILSRVLPIAAPTSPTCLSSVHTKEAASLVSTCGRRAPACRMCAPDPCMVHQAGRQAGRVRVTHTLCRACPVRPACAPWCPANTTLHTWPSGHQVGCLLRQNVINTTLHTYLHNSTSTRIPTIV